MKRKTKRNSQPRSAFLLVLVLVVLALATFAALNFSNSMMNSRETATVSGGQLQARMCAESGLQTVRLFCAYDRLSRLNMGGDWNNPQMFQAINIIPDIDPTRRGNFTILAPSLDQEGNYAGIRYGLHNESTKINLNTLAQIDSLLGSAPVAAGAGSTQAGSQAGSQSGSSGQLASAMMGGSGLSIAQQMLMGLPGMTIEIADAILDFIDSDDDPRPNGAEFVDYYQQMQPIYKPANAQLTSIEQLLLVRGVTPLHLYGYDENHNGVLDGVEISRQSLGLAPGAQPGEFTTATTTPGVSPPPPLGWAPYLTLHSQEKNVMRDGLARININSEDLQTLYSDLSAALGNENYASFIIAYRLAGRPSASAATNPLLLLTGGGGFAGGGGGGNGRGGNDRGGDRAGGDRGNNGGNGQNQGNQNSGRSQNANQGQQLASQSPNQSSSNQNQRGQNRSGGQSGLLSAAPANDNQPNGRGNNRGGGGGDSQNPFGGAAVAQGESSPPKMWTSSEISKFDLTQPGAVQFNQLLDLVDATVVLNNQNGEQVTYTSPFSSSPVDMSVYTPLIMDKLTTLEAKAIPGRINIMECPREILMGLPTMTEEIVQNILQARVDGSDSETRNFETWLCCEGYLTVDQMRTLMPLITCSGDVYKAQIVGYLEGNSAFSRVEAIVSGAGQIPEVLFFRRLDHLERSFDIPTLGQRFDANLNAGIGLQ